MPVLMSKSIKLWAAGLVCLAFPVHADPLPMPTGPVVLTITGNLGVTNSDGSAIFDVEMLRSLGETDIVTDTNWTSGVHTFTGALLLDILARVEADGTTVNATAINDYSVEIPVSDASETSPIIAYALDGKPMPRREKGPLWVIYPYASSSKFQTEVIYSRSIWQLDRMSIK